MQPDSESSKSVAASTKLLSPSGSSSATGRTGHESFDTDPEASLRTEQLPEIPGYDIQSLLGRGGMGIVLLARHQTLGRPTAIKLVRNLGTDDASRLRREAEAIARLSHPNIVQIFEVGEVGGELYLALEYVPDGSLRPLMSDRSVSSRRAAQLLESLARGIAHAHSRGLIHRDLKPANILVRRVAGPSAATDASTQTGSRTDSGAELDLELTPLELRIADFGLAKDLLSDAGQTRTGVFLGTPRYAAPEQVSAAFGRVGPATDIYSLGAILYELLTATPIHRERVAVDVLHAIVTQEIVAPRLLVPSVNHDLETICLKCLQREPSERYRSAEEFADDLRRFLTGEPIAARPVSRIQATLRWIKRKPAIAAGITAGFIAVVAIAMASVSFAYQDELRAANTELTQRNTELDRERTAVGVARDQAQSALSEAEEARRLLDLYRYAADMNIAAVAWDEGDSQRTAKLLDQQHPNVTGTDLRGFEWYYLRSQQLAPMLQTDGGAAAITRDGKIAVLSRGDSLAVLDAIKWQVLRQIPFEHQGITDVALSGDGRIVLAGGYDNTATAFNVETGEKLCTLTGHQYAIETVELNHDGSRAWTGSRDKSVRLWDTSSGRPMASGDGNEAMLYMVALSPDGKLLASVDGTHRVRLWNPETMAPVRTINSPGSKLLSVEWHPTSGHLCCGGGNQLTFFDANTGEPLPSITQRAFVGDIGAFNADGTLLATSDRSGFSMIFVYDFASGRKLRTLRGQTQTSRLFWHPLNSQLLSTSYPGVTFVWDAARDQAGQRMSEKPCRAIAITADSKTIIWTEEDGSIHFGTDGKLAALRQPDALRRYAQLAVDPQGRWLAFTATDGSVRVWNTTTESEQFVLAGHKPSTMFVLANADGSKLFSSGWDKTVRAWDPLTGEPLGTMEGHTDAVYSLSIDERRGILASGQQSMEFEKPGAFRFWSLADFKQVAELPGVNVPQELHFSPDGSMIASTGSSQRGDFTLLDGEDGHVVAMPDGHSSFVTSMSFSPDGKRIATGSFDGAIKLWDLSSNQQTLTLRAGHSRIDTVQFSPDGQKLYCASADGLRVWDATAGYAVEVATDATQ